MSKVTDNLSAATNIPFPEFTAAMIEGVFETVLDMTLRQTEDYINLVKEVSMTLTEYINNTVDDVDPMEILDLLDQLPPIEFNSGTTSNPVNTDLAGLLAATFESQEGTPPASPPADLTKAPSSALSALNQQISIPGIINAGSGAVVDITGAISSAAARKDDAFRASIGAIMENGKMIAYDPVAFDALPANPLANTDMQAISMAKIYDAIAANVSANKYALLQEMVKLGMVRIVIDKGLLETAMTFESVTTVVTETSKKLQNKNKASTKYKRKQRRGRFARLFKGKDKRKSKSKTRTVNVSTYKERHLNSQTERGSLMGRSVIHWHTDYVPVRES
ncbi:MAG: hypothetical protein L3J65_11225 [Robiginitomaculum sp.]|nr:hypothetical protein [Robiginitomaculum sp.]